MIVAIAASAPAAQSKNLKKMKRILFFSIPLLVSFNLFAKEVYIGPGFNAQEKLQEALILMEEGDTLIMMPESGRALTHQEAVEMVREWITQLPNNN